MALVSWGIMWYIFMLERHVFGSKENQNKKPKTKPKPGKEGKTVSSLHHMEMALHTWGVLEHVQQV